MLESAGEDNLAGKVLIDKWCTRMLDSRARP